MMDKYPIPPDSMRFTCSSAIFDKIIKEASFGGIFPRITLNFDKGHVWWEHISKKKFFVHNYGFFSYNYVKDYQGSGTACLPTEWLLKYNKFLKKTKPKTDLTFWISNEKGIWGVEKSGTIFTHMTIPITNTHTTNANNMKININKDFIPILPKEKDEEQFRYGGEFEGSHFGTLFKGVKKDYKSNMLIQLTRAPPTIKIIDVKLQEIYSLSEKKIDLKVPVTTVNYSVPILVFKTAINKSKKEDKFSILFSNNNKRPILILKTEREKNSIGIFVSGVLMHTTDIEPINPQTQSLIDAMHDTPPEVLEQ